MKVDFLSLAITAGLVMHITPPATATPTILRSPETAQTYADNSIFWRQLRWLPSSNQLVATITFSNIDYVSRVEPRHDETFTFPLPGVRFTAKTGTVYVPGPQGHTIPVARLRRGLIGQTVELLPTARMLVTNRSGCVAVRLVTGQPPSAGDLWVER